MFNKNDIHKYINYIWNILTNKNKYLNFKKSIIFILNIILLVILICIVVIIYLNNIPVKNKLEESFQYYSISYDSKLSQIYDLTINPNELKKIFKIGNNNIKILFINLEFKSNMDTTILSQAVNYNNKNEIYGIIKFQFNNTENILSFIINLNDSNLLVDNTLLTKYKTKYNDIEDYLLINSIEIDNNLQWKNLNIGFYKKIEKKKRNEILIKPQKKQPIPINIENPIQDNFYKNIHKNNTPEKKIDTFGIVPKDIKDNTQKEVETIVKQINNANKNIIKPQINKFNGIGKNITVANMHGNFIKKI